MAYLVKPGTARARPLELGDGSLIIGRSKSCALVLDHPKVSREHARVCRQLGQFVIEDLRSRNGTHVNDNRITGPTPLADGDMIRICNIHLCFRLFLDAHLEDDRTENNHADPVIQSSLDLGLEDTARFDVRPEVRLRALLEITRSLHDTLYLDRLLPRVLETLFNIFPAAQSGFILTVDEATGALVPKAAQDRDGRAEGPVRFSQTLVHRALERKQAILSTDASRDQQLQPSQSIRALGIRSVLCVPLLRRDREPLGILQITSYDQEDAFGPEDLEILVSLAGVIGMALENARLHQEEIDQERTRREAQLARDVQLCFLPQKTPMLEGYSFFDYYEPARSVGGDYYAYVELPGQHLAIAVGDVSGKGMPAALLMARFTGDVRHALLVEPRAGPALARLNSSLHASEIEGRFITLALLILDPQRHVLSLANAGHVCPVLRRPGHRLEELGKDRGGLPLNVSLEAEHSYQEISVPLDTGASVLLYSDGVSDARNRRGEMFGQERLFQAFGEGPGEAPVAGQRIIDALQRFSEGAPAHDDATLVCFGRKR